VSFKPDQNYFALAPNYSPYFRLIQGSWDPADAAIASPGRSYEADFDGKGLSEGPNVLFLGEGLP